MSTYKNHNKKSQMEIIGLMVIVILISLSILFILQFVVQKSSSDIKKSYTHTQLAANTLNALLKTTTDCKEQDITDLLRDCASGETIFCENKGSCQVAIDIINEIFSKTLLVWSKQFEFTVKIDNSDVIPPITNQQCLERETEIYPISTDAGIMIIRLDICN